MAPTASPVTVCVPSVTPAVESVRTTSKLPLTFKPPTFWTVTPMEAVLPWVTALGATTLLTATSVTGGASTITLMPTVLFEGSLSASLTDANSVCPVTAAPAVFQSNVRVAIAPTASPAIVCVPRIGPLNPSVNTTSKLVVTSCPPTFFTVTTICAVSPWFTRAGPVMPVMATSVPGGGGGGGGGGPGGAGAVTLIAIPMLLFAELSSGSLLLAKSVCPVTAAPAVFHRISTVVVDPAARPGTLAVPTTGTAHPSLSSMVKGEVTSTSPTFWTVTTTCAVSPWATERGPVIPVTAISSGLGVIVTTVVRRLLAALSSVRASVATSVCPPSAAPVVFQLKTSVVLVPAASPWIVSVPSVTPAVESCRVTGMSPVTF